MKLKQNISKRTYDTEHLSPLLEKLRHETQGFKVPDGYFDSLSPRIIDGIKMQENRSIIKIISRSFRKPLIWIPSMSTVIVVILLIFVIPSRKTSTIPVVDEWTEIKMAYDASYAEEARLAESYTLDKEIESSVVSNIGSETLIQNELSIDEINEYLKEHDTGIDILNEY
jgi:hypothetical protein